ncbi:unnamed protein product [Closterium sp. NIES-54]
MSPTPSGKSEVFLPCTPNDASALKASAVTHPHDQIHQEIDECALTGAPQCTPEDAFTLMELSDVVGGNAVPDGDHLAGPCDMDGGMDGDLLEGDDVLGASWDACDHTGNLEAILRCDTASSSHGVSFLPTLHRIPLFLFQYLFFQRTKSCISLKSLLLH